MKQSPGAGVVECARCGAAADAAEGTCPVCELPLEPAGPSHVGDSSSASVQPAATLVGRLWQSGRLAVLVAAALFLVATFVPLVHVQRSHEVGPRVSASAYLLAMGEGVYGRELKSSVVLAIPAAALGLVSFVYSRRAGSHMRASRPLVLVVSLLPLAAAVLPLLRLARIDRFKYDPGPALVLVALGAVSGLLGGLRFGTGVAELLAARRRGASHDDD